MDKIKFVGVVIVAVLSIIHALKSKGISDIGSLVNQFIIKARDLYNTSETQAKFDYVLQMVKSELPFPINLLISEKLIKTMIQNTFDEVLKDDFYKTEDKQTKILDEVENLIKSNVEPMNLLTKVTEMKKDIEEKGAITAYIESDSKNTKIGAKITKKF